MIVFFTEEMPKTCLECRHCVCNGNSDRCTLSGENLEAVIENDSLSEHCPLEKVPSLRSPHSNSIKRQKYYEGFNAAVKVIASGKRREKKQ